MIVKQVCVVCGRNKWGCNAKGVCPDCVYMKNHGGKSKFEVAIEKRKKKKETSILYKKRKPIKSRKSTILKRKILLEKDFELYLFTFNKKPNKCEECGEELPSEFKDSEGNINMIEQYSHIISKGSQPKFRHHKLNMNRLCPKCHTRWESGDRENMKIYEENQLIIKEIHATEIIN